jgi:drug/metabolite transporter (DMT)-like permease
MTARSRVGLVLGFAGIVLLVGFPAVPVTARFVVGCAAGLGAAVSAAWGSNYARRHLGAVGSWEQAIGAFVAGGLLGERLSDVQLAGGVVIVVGCALVLGLVPAQPRSSPGR